MAVLPKVFDNENLAVNMPLMGVIAGSLVCASTPTINTGKGFTVSKPSTGIFRVTPNHRCPRIIAAPGHLHKLAATTEACFLNAIIWDDANGYVEYRVENASGAAADPAVTDIISFTIFVLRAKLPKK